MREACRRLMTACHMAWRLPGFKVIVRGAVDPLSCGFRRAVGSPRRGKLLDAEALGYDCSRCHVVVFRDLVEVHRDSVSPSCNPLAHLLLDAWKHFAGAQGLLTLLSLVTGNTWLGVTGIASLLAALLLRALVGVAR